MKSIIIFLGPLASGKGTQASLLEKKFGFVSLSTGSLLRKEVASGSALGEDIAAKINRGDLVSDDLVFDIVTRRIKNSDAKGFVFDGFPRTFHQVEMLEDFISQNPDEFKIVKVFDIRVPKEEVLKRIGHRFSCKKCGTIYNSSSKKPMVDGICDSCGSTDFESRDDDMDMKAIMNRIDIYNANVDNIVDFYEKKGLIFFIDGLKSIEAVSEEMVKAIEDVNDYKR